MFCHRVTKGLLLLLLLSAAFAQELTKHFTNKDVVDLLGLGLSEDVVIAKIRAADAPQFDTGVEALKALKEAKVPDAVIKAMINPKAPMVSAAANERASEWPEEIGVYAVVKGKIEEMVPEVVNWRTGGVLKSFATGGLTKGHVNGTVANKQAKLQIPTPLEFIIRCPEGTSAAEYQLLKLDEHGDRREFRALTGGIIHASGGADKNRIEFQFEKVAPRVFRLKIASAGRGEYGFLPPGVNSASMASGGKMYTFGVIE